MRLIAYLSEGLQHELIVEEGNCVCHTVLLYSGGANNLKLH